MMRMYRCSAFFVATLFVLVFVAGCDTSTARNGGDGGVDDAGNVGADSGGLPPGANCVVDLDAGAMVARSCLDNPVLPTCHQCVDPNADGDFDDSICVFTCRMGEQDCPPGETCALANSSSRTGYQDCRDLTDDYELGYCQ